MKLSDIKPGMRIEDIRVSSSNPRYGVILRVDKNNISTITGKKLPIIIGLPTGKNNYIEWWTSLDYFNRTWKFVDNANKEKKPKRRRIKKPAPRKNKTQA